MPSEVLAFSIETLLTLTVSVALNVTVQNHRMTARRETEISTRIFIAKILISTDDLVDTPGFQARDGMRAVAFEYIEVFYNRKRLHSWATAFPVSCSVTGVLTNKRRKE